MFGWSFRAVVRGASVCVCVCVCVCCSRIWTAQVLERGEGEEGGGGLRFRAVEVEGWGISIAWIVQDLFLHLSLHFLAFFSPQLRAEPNAETRISPAPGRKQRFGTKNRADQSDAERKSFACPERKKEKVSRFFFLCRLASLPFPFSFFFVSARPTSATVTSVFAANSRSLCISTLSAGILLPLFY